MFVDGKVEAAQVRLPVDLKEWLRREALANYRTLNAEVVKRLEESRAADQREPARS